MRNSWVELPGATGCTGAGTGGAKRGKPEPPPDGGTQVGRGDAYAYRLASLHMHTWHSALIQTISNHIAQLYISTISCAGYPTGIPWVTFRQGRRLAPGIGILLIAYTKKRGALHDPRMSYRDPTGGEGRGSGPPAGGGWKVGGAAHEQSERGGPLSFVLCTDGCTRLWAGVLGEPPEEAGNPWVHPAVGGSARGNWPPALKT